jgi:hypothetical protein
MIELSQWGGGGVVKLLESVDISTCAPWIMLNEQHITACTSTNLMDSTGMQDSSWARCPQMEGHWKKKILQKWIDTQINKSSAPQSTWSILQFQPECMYTKYLFQCKFYYMSFTEH